jgi:hypothetical protein
MYRNKYPITLIQLMEMKLMDMVAVVLIMAVQVLMG